mmetsp:Transcript_97111/g.277892  ORF Transcript_97111/g.277892 Transcript_97111/m.277892 type:complete len:278 (+) Transcript_97111:303-1136(+)
MVHWPFRSRMPSAAFIVALMLAEVVFQGHARVVDLVNDAGLVAEDDSFDTATANTVILNNTLYNTTGLSPLTPGDTVVIPNTTIHFIGGIRIYHLTNVTMIIDGTMHFGSDAWDLPHVWPTDSSGEIEDCIRIENVLDFTITSSLGTHESNAGYKGVLDGWGHRWWGVPGIGYLVHGERRPKLIQMKSCNNSVVEHILLKNSPYWTLSTQKSDHVTIRYTNVDVRRTRYDGHDRIDMSAFNTDGFDVSGEYVHIHDCDIWNQDDCIAVKEVRASESD